MASYDIGFYWVKTATIPDKQIGEWQPAFFTGDWWEICGNDRPKPEEYFAEIGEPIKSPYQPVRGNT